MELSQNGKMDGFFHERIVRNGWWLGYLYDSANLHIGAHTECFSWRCLTPRRFFPLPESHRMMNGSWHYQKLPEIQKNITIKEQKGEKKNEIKNVRKNKNKKDKNTWHQITVTSAFDLPWNRCVESLVTCISIPLWFFNMRIQFDAQHDDECLANWQKPWLSHQQTIPMTDPYVCYIW